MVVRPAVRRLVVAGRLLNFGFFFLTSIFCLLASSPFANEQFLKPHISSWLTNFVAFHTDFYWLALSVTALTMAPFLNRSPAKTMGWSYLAGAAAIGVWLATNRVMPDVDAPRHALALAIAAMVPPALLAIFDHRVDPFPMLASDRADWRVPAACALAAIFCWATFAAPVPVRLSNGGLSIAVRDWWEGAAIAAVAHAAAFSGVCAALLGVSWAAGATRLGSRIEFASAGAVASLLGGWLIVRLFLAPIAIVGPGAWTLGFVAASSIVLVWSGVARYLAPVESAGVTVLDLWCAPLALRPLPLALGVLLLMAPVAFFLVGRVSMFDWDFMFQKAIAVAVGVTGLAMIHAMLRKSAVSGRRGTVTAAVALVFFVAATAGASAFLRTSPVASPSSTYVAADPALRLARDLLARRDESSAGYYAYLRANTGITTAVAPVNVDLVSGFGRSMAPPHVFLFVIDSLRPDYLGAYNPAVTFTPAIDAFARDSFVFRRAYSRYGGTGLSVPAIWAAGMVLHKEYVTPFAPMNALAKLLSAHDYRRFITADHITDALFPRSPDTVDLDRTVPEMRHTLCGTLDQMQQSLAAAPRSPRPIFGHTRPLDLHIGNIWTARPEPGESFPGFHPPYASRVHRMDACFGRFLEFLRRDGLYDDSVVILTADHGDSLGEGLRWGHGFTVFPEVLRIPLIVHLPRRFASGLAADVDRVSFTVDITPTLYALLGDAPATREPLEGSSLFAPSRAELTDRRTAPFLVASSYGPSYGILSGNGTRLYIADGVNGREYDFELDGSAAGRPLSLTDEQRAAARRIVREQIDALAGAYRFAPPAPAMTP